MIVNINFYPCILLFTTLSGAMRSIKKTHSEADLVKKTFGVSALDEIYEAERIVRNGQQYFSKLYKNDKEYVTDKTVGAVQYFLFDKCTMMVMQLSRNFTWEPHHFWIKLMEESI